MKENSVSVQLRRLNHQIMRYVDNSPGKRKIDSVTGTNGWVICYLSDHADCDIFQKDLEKRLSITRSTASKIITSMEQKGLLERKSVPQDARLKKVVLTRKAVELGAMVQQDRALLEQKLTRGFTEEETVSLLNFLERMQDNMQNTKEENLLNKQP